MTTGFAPKEVIESGHHKLEVLSAETADTYGPQLAFKLKIVGGERDSYQFIDYANRDEDTEEVKQGGKAWSIFESALGRGFHKNVSSLEDALAKLEGRQFMAQITQTRTGSRNKIEHGTVGPVPARESSSLRSAQQQAGEAADAGDEEDFDSIPW